MFGWFKPKRAVSFEAVVINIGGTDIDALVTASSLNARQVAAVRERLDATTRRKHERFSLR